MEFAKILKANPYHDEKGQFSTQDKAKFVSTGGVFDKQRKPGFTAVHSSGSRDLTAFTGDVTHSTSSSSAESIKSNGFTPTRGMLDTGVYFVHGKTKDNTAASSEVQVSAKVKNAKLLEVDSVKDLMEFGKNNNITESLDKGLGKLGYQGVRLKKPYSGNSDPWVVVYDTKVIHLDSKK